MSQRYGNVVYQFIRGGYAFFDRNGKVLLTEKGIRVAEQLIGYLAFTYYQDRRSSCPIIQLEE